jgi:hypothetical protein
MIAPAVLACIGDWCWVEDRLPGDPGKGVRFVVMLPTVDKQDDLSLNIFYNKY